MLVIKTYFYFLCHMKYCLALILMIMLSLQVLPVKKVGKLLCKVQGTEQVQDDQDTDDYTPSNDLYLSGTIVPRVTFDLSTNNGYFENKIATFIRRSDVLPAVQVRRIPSPPPEC